MHGSISLYKSAGVSLILVCALCLTGCSSDGDYWTPFQNPEYATQPSSSTTMPPVITTQNTTAPISQTASVAEAIAKNSASVVHIEVNYSLWYASGSGVVINPNGYIITSNHVVERGYSSITVTFPDNKQLTASVAFRDVDKDLAILKCSGRDFAFVTLGSADALYLGDDVIIMGYPSAAVIGDSVTVSKGIISQFRSIDGEDYIQTDAPTNPGCSGGPLINLKGEVIGIISFKVKDTESLNFAINANSIKSYVNYVVQELIAGRIVSPDIPASSAPQTSSIFTPSQPTTSMPQTLTKPPLPLSGANHSAGTASMCLLCHGPGVGAQQYPLPPTWAGTPLTPGPWTITPGSPQDHTGRSNTDICITCHAKNW